MSSKPPTKTSYRYTPVDDSTYESLSHIPEAKVLTPPKRAQFPKVKEAREEMRKRAQELVELSYRIVYEAIANGDLDVAAKQVQWLAEHMPKEDDGTTMIDSSVDKGEKSSGSSSGPAVQIAFALGGLSEPKKLPKAEVIDTEAEEVK